MPHNILVVDDEPLVCDVTCRLLREAGYACEGLYSARAVLGFLGSGRADDLFLLDIRLPDMSGLTLAHLIAVQYPTTPFLFISGFPKSQGEGLPTSPWAFLPKPFSNEELLGAVRQLLPQEPAIPPQQLERLPALRRTPSRSRPIVPPVALHRPVGPHDLELDPPRRQPEVLELDKCWAVLRCWASYRYVLLRRGPMYVLVQHTISDPTAFWNAADPRTLSPKAKLHHTFPAPDGARAVCIWEADTVEALRNLLEPVVGKVSRNEYFAVENREGFAFPSRVPREAAAAGTAKR